MAASLIVNRDAALSALWWMYEGATISVVLADTTGAASPPSAQADLGDWFSPTNYALSEDYDLFVVGGTASYDATVTTRAKIPQLQFVLDYPTTVTYTDLLLFSFPAIQPGASYPDNSIPFIGVIHESTPITLASTESKTYNVNLYSEWL